MMTMVSSWETTIQDRHEAKQTLMRGLRGSSGWESVIHQEGKYSLAQQNRHLELDMILTSCPQVGAEELDDNPEATGC